MGDASRHFSWYEFRCRCLRPCQAKDGTVVQDVILMLEELRALLTILPGREVYIVPSSGLRCEEHDRDLQDPRYRRAATGYHSKGLAVDFSAYYLAAGHPVWLPGYEIVNVANQMPQFAQGSNGGIGTGELFVHLDLRTEQAARWRY